jgi:hypothetical protein
MHTYSNPGTYQWAVTASVLSSTVVANGSIEITDVVSLALLHEESSSTIIWPETKADTLLEGSDSLGPSTQWRWITNLPSANSGLLKVTVPESNIQFFRVRRPW